MKVNLEPSNTTFLQIIEDYARVWLNKARKRTANTEWNIKCSNPQSLNNISERLQKPRKSILEISFTKEYLEYLQIQEHRKQ